MKVTRLRSLFACLSVAVISAVINQPAHADLLGYWSGNSTNGQGTILPNDQGNIDLDGELFDGAVYSAAGDGVTGAPNDYAIVFPGEDADYAAIPPTDEEFEEIT
ncbi:MAG: hypothetical protein KDB23_12895, partial [Planctomycetales bacterium]|nr:hypothetical protein [Planctomycetales bacterium]